MKKMLTFCFLIIALSMASISAKAQLIAEIVSNGSFSMGFTLSVKCDGEIVSYQWYRAASPSTTTVTNISQDETYTVVYDDIKKYIGVVLTLANGTTVSTERVYIDDILYAYKGATNVGEYADKDKQYAFYNPPRETPPENIFIHNGYAYILLDRDHEKSFILADDVYGKKMLDEYPANNHYHQDAPGTLAKWLNNDFINGDVPQTEGKSVDKAILPYLVEVYWRTEGNRIAGAVNRYDNVSKGKFALLSMTEFIKYSDKIGYQPRNLRGVTIPKMIITRTPLYNDNRKYLYYRANNGSISNTNPTDPNGTNFMNFYIRPCFYLSHDFFANVRLDVETLGANVKRMLVENYPYEQMIRIYSPAELEAIGYTEDKTVVSNAGILGRPVVGNQLSVYYELYNLKDNVSIHCSWFSADNKDGEYTKVCDGEYFVPAPAYNGKYLKAVVTAQDTVTGEIYSATAAVSPPIGGATDVSVENVSITFDERYARAQFTLKGNTGFTVVLATYDGSGILTGITSNRYSVNGSRTEAFSVEMGNSVSAKLVILTDSESLNPICAITKNKL